MVLKNSLVIPVVIVSAKSGYQKQFQRQERYLPESMLAA